MQPTAPPTSIRVIVRRARNWLFPRRTRQRPALSVGVIHDPYTQMQMIGISGHITPDTLATLADAFAEVPDYAPLHLDLTGAVVVAPIGWRQVELLIDSLERRRVKLHVVGLDPVPPVVGQTRRF